MDTADSCRKCLTSSTNLLHPSRYPTCTAAGSKDPAVSPRCTVHGTLGGVNYIQCTSQLEETNPVRSEMVFKAKHTLPNRYMLCRVLATATRKFHKPATRIEETTDAMLRRIASSNATALWQWSGNKRARF